MTTSEPQENTEKHSIYDEIRKLSEEQAVLKKNFRDMYTTYDFSLELINDALDTIEYNRKPTYFDIIAVLFYSTLLIGVVVIFVGLFIPDKYLFTGTSMLLCSVEVIFLIVLVFCIYRLEDK